MLEEFSEKLDKLDITGNKEVAHFMNAASTTLSMLFDVDEEDVDEKEWFQIVKNKDLTIDQKINMLLALEETNIIIEE